MLCFNPRESSRPMVFHYLDWSDYVDQDFTRQPSRHDLRSWRYIKGGWAGCSVKMLGLPPFLHDETRQIGCSRVTRPMLNGSYLRSAAQHNGRIRFYPDSAKLKAFALRFFQIGNADQFQSPPCIALDTEAAFF